MIIVYVGTYTSDSSKGIYSYRLDEGTGRLEQFGEPVVLANPSYLTTNKDNKFLYAVIETGEFKGQYGGAVASFSIDGKTGALTFINCQPTKGKDPCHLVLDNSGRYLVAANYTEGALTEFPVRDDGGLGESAAVIAHEGCGPNAERQEKPHVHFVQFTPDGKYLCVVDLGIDKVMIYDFDSKTGNLKHNEELTINIRPGSGPRHLVFHPDGRFVYVVNELSSEVAVYEYSSEESRFHELQYISTLPEGFEGSSICAAVRISTDGKFLYASNRGHDSIAIFKVKTSGRLELVSNIAADGRFPRDFAIDPTGHYAYAANQESDSIVPFAIKGAGGTLDRNGEIIRIGRPVCIRFVTI